MPYRVALAQAESLYPEYDFVEALTPGEQKAAFHVKDQEGSDLCLKLIAPGYSLERLNREIQALQAVAHPNVAAFKEYTFSSKKRGQRHHIVEEFIPGEDLTHRLDSGGSWSTQDVATFFAEICHGLHALHLQGIVHRDLKPSNIRIRPDGSPVLIDLGLARHLALPDLTKTSDGAAIGTPLYFAPEQFHGTKRDIDQRTDLFALGVLLYKALVGKHPFWPPDQNCSLTQTVCQSLAYRAEPSFLSLPRPWQLLVNRMLEKQRVRRPQDAGQVSRMLQRFGGTT